MEVTKNGKLYSIVLVSYYEILSQPKSFFNLSDHSPLISCFVVFMRNLSITIFYNDLWSKNIFLSGSQNNFSAGLRTSISDSQKVHTYETRNDIQCAHHTKVYSWLDCSKKYTGAEKETETKSRAR